MIYPQCFHEFLVKFIIELSTLICSEHFAYAHFHEYLKWINIVEAHYYDNNTETVASKLERSISF